MHEPRLARRHAVPALRRAAAESELTPPGTPARVGSAPRSSPLAANRRFWPPHSTCDGLSNRRSVGVGSHRICRNWPAGDLDVLSIMASDDSQKLSDRSDYACRSADSPPGLNLVAHTVLGKTLSVTGGATDEYRANDQGAEAMRPRPVSGPSGRNRSVKRCLHRGSSRRSCRRIGRHPPGSTRLPAPLPARPPGLRARREGALPRRWRLR
jgi:hypothetical protein